MKNKTTKKLFAFMLLVSGIFSLTVANAQIVYTDVIPDDSVSCFLRPTFIANCIDSVNLDLNNDGSMDFILIFERFKGTDVNDCYHYNEYAGVSTIDNNSFYGIVSSNPSALNYSNIIDSKLIWSNDSGILRYYNYDSCRTPVIDTSGNWGLTNDQYLPVKISITGNNYFGWIRMRMDISGIEVNGFVLKDYAFNSTPNQFILAGDIGTGTVGIIENVASSSINLFPNPSINQLTIALGSNNRKVEVTITDITGKVIYTTITTDTEKVEVNTKGFAEGIYIVQVQSADFIATKKLVVEK